MIPSDTPGAVYEGLFNVCDVIDTGHYPGIRRQKVMQDRLR